jgi:hypothetical protein
LKIDEADDHEANHVVEFSWRQQAHDDFLPPPDEETAKPCFKNQKHSSKTH